jgi:glutaredoxin 3
MKRDDPAQLIASQTNGAGTPHVTIYTKPTCPYCIAVKALLRGKGVTYSEINIEGDGPAAAALAGRTGRRTVPQVFIGASHLGGYDDVRALDAAGGLYPLLGL